MKLRYNVRSRYLVDIVNDLKQKKLILSPYFQRKLVWRETHKVDFIGTILLGYPFPEVFLSRGRINLDDMTSTSSVVDGQQRLNAILDFVDNRLEVDGLHFKDLDAATKEAFLKYEIAIIDLDLADNDSTIIDIFKRLNRTFYALSTIEKQATEYASSEYMLIAKFMAAEVGKYDEEDSSFDMDDAKAENDPNMTAEFMTWCRSTNVRPFHRWLLDADLFSDYEVARQVHLSYTLLIMSTLLHGLFQRNDQVKDDLENYVPGLPNRDEIVGRMVRAAAHFDRAKPPAFWRRKANAFTLIVALDTALRAGITFKAAELRARLTEFEERAPLEYLLAAREGVNNRKERLTRHAIICESIFNIDVDRPVL